MSTNEFMRNHKEELEKIRADEREGRLKRAFSQDHNLSLDELLTDAFRSSKGDIMAEQVSRILCSVDGNEERKNEYDAFARAAHNSIYSTHYNPSRNVSMVTALQTFQRLGSMSDKIVQAYTELIIKDNDSLLPSDQLPGWINKLPDLKDRLDEETFKILLNILGYAKRTYPFEYKREQVTMGYITLDFAKNHGEKLEKLLAYLEAAEKHYIFGYCRTFPDVYKDAVKVLSEAPEVFDKYAILLENYADGLDESDEDAPKIEGFMHPLVDSICSLNPHDRELLINLAHNLPVDRYHEKIPNIKRFIEDGDIDEAKEYIAFLKKGIDFPFDFYDAKEKTRDGYVNLLSRINDSMEGPARGMAHGKLFNLFNKRINSPRLNQIRRFVENGIKLYESQGEESAVAYFGQETNASKEMLKQPWYSKLWPW